MSAPQIWRQEDQEFIILSCASNSRASGFLRLCLAITIIMIIQDVEMKCSHKFPPVILNQGLFKDAFPQPQADIFVFVCARVLM